MCACAVCVCASLCVYEFVCGCVRCVCVLTQHHNKSGISRGAGNTAVQEGAYRGPVGACSTQCACRSRQVERKIKKQSVRTRSSQLSSLLLNSFSAPEVVLVSCVSPYLCVAIIVQSRRDLLQLHNNI